MNIIPVINRKEPGERKTENILPKCIYRVQRIWIVNNESKNWILSHRKEIGSI